MDLQLSHKLHTMFSHTSAPLSLQYVLEQGQKYVHEGYYAEAAALLSLVRAMLTSNTSVQIRLACLLDTFLQEYVNYRYSQQVLQDAGVRFAEAQKEQQEHTLVLSTMVANLLDISYIDEVVGEDTAQSDVGRVTSLTSDESIRAELFIVCFGQFAVKASGKPVALCASRNGQAILRYLVAQSGHHAKSDTLQTLFWPDDEPEVAQRKLHVAISSLRRSLNIDLTMKSTVVHEHDIILHKNRVYSLNPAIAIRTDVDDFLRYYHMGQQENQNEQPKIAYYEQACQLYTGPFLSEDLYADWSFLQRERFSQAYSAMCNVLAEYYLHHKQFEDAAKWATAILQENRCDEAAHYQLIQIYIAQGKRSEAYQQYQRCEHIMREELGVGLLPETVHIFQQHFQDGFPR